MNLLIKNLEHALSIKFTPDQIAMVENVIEADRQTLLGFDLGTPSGDHTAKTYGYIKNGKLVVTKIKFSKPKCGKVGCDIIGVHAHAKPHKPYLGGRTKRHLDRLKNS